MRTKEESDNNKNAPGFIKQLPPEMILAILQANCTMNDQKKPVLQPKNMAAIALTSNQFNELSKITHCIFSGNNYKKTRENYLQYKQSELQIASTISRIKAQADDYLNPGNTRRVTALIWSLILGIFLALAFDSFSTPMTLLIIGACSAFCLLLEQITNSHNSLSQIEQQYIAKIPEKFNEEYLQAQDARTKALV